ncbi:hypothetical protein H0H92_010864, partial [Tricholoma furcatifolium]
SDLTTKTIPMHHLHLPPRAVTHAASTGNSVHAHPAQLPLRHGHFPHSAQPTPRSHSTLSLQPFTILGARGVGKAALRSGLLMGMRRRVGEVIRTPSHRRLALHSRGACVAVVQRAARVVQHEQEE